MEKSQKAGFFTLTKEKKRRKLERARRKKTKLIVEFLVFVLATFEILFYPKKRDFDGRDLFANSARYEIF